MTWLVLQAISMMIYQQFLNSNVVLIPLNAVLKQNEVPAAEMVMVTCQIMQCDDKKTELIIGKQICLPTDYSNSELVLGHNYK